jgi:hypothetical protein
MAATRWPDGAPTNVQSGFLRNLWLCGTRFKLQIKGINIAPEELRETLHRSPFEPFRLVMTVGTGHDIRHPDLLWVGRRSAMVGQTGNPAHTFYEWSVKVDLLHVIRLEPLEMIPPSTKNGPGT